MGTQTCSRIVCGVFALFPIAQNLSAQQTATPAKPARREPLVITEALYEASVSADGCLTSLKIKGEEFLRGARSRGASTCSRAARSASRQ